MTARESSIGWLCPCSILRAALTRKFEGLRNPKVARMPGSANLHGDGSCSPRCGVGARMYAGLGIRPRKEAGPLDLSDMDCGLASRTTAALSVFKLSKCNLQIIKDRCQFDLTVYQSGRGDNFELSDPPIIKGDAALFIEPRGVKNTIGLVGVIVERY